MSTSIASLMVDEGPAIYYDQAFMQVLESHLHLIRDHPSTNQVEIDPQIAYKHEFDFNGLMRALNIPLHYSYAIMRVNGINSPTDYTHDRTTLLIPSTGVIDGIRLSHSTTYKNG